MILTLSFKARALSFGSRTVKKKKNKTDSNQNIAVGPRSSKYFVTMFGIIGHED